MIPPYESSYIHPNSYHQRFTYVYDAFVAMSWVKMITADHHESFRTTDPQTLSEDVLIPFDCCKTFTLKLWKSKFDATESGDEMGPAADVD